MNALPSGDCPLTQRSGLGPYFSALAGDPDMGPLVAQFVDELPSRLAALQRAASNGDIQEVGRLAHQLKGAGGSYGFQQLGLAAAAVERAARSLQFADEVFAAMKQLALTCEQTRSGTPPLDGEQSLLYCGSA